MLGPRSGFLEKEAQATELPKAALCPAPRIPHPRRAAFCEEMARGHRGSVHPDDSTAAGDAVFPGELELARAINGRGSKM